METPEAQLASFLAKFDPEVEALALAILERMRARIPGAQELVYENYNALAIGFSANEKLSGTHFSVAVYPRWVSLFFSGGPTLPDPQGILKGNGATVRHVVLKTPEEFEAPALQALLTEALLRAIPPIDPTAPRRLIIKSISANQRPRRTAQTKTR